MMQLFQGWFVIVLLGCLPGLSPAQAQTGPVMQIEAVSPDGVRFQYVTAEPYQLEENGPLLGGWQPASEAMTQNGNNFEVRLHATALARYFRLRAVPATTLQSTSPTDDETGVAATRETIIHFSSPLAADTVLSANNFFATFGGRRLLSRIELASDRTKATLFYLEPLPGSARVSVTFDAHGLKDAFGRRLDPADTGELGGSKSIQFVTLNLTALAGTAVVGRVFASELMPGSDTGTNAVNRPLAGVTITVDGMEETLRAVTDANGNFTLNPVPPGRFFVHIDGRTASDAAAGIHYPDQAYYPFVGKAWDAVAGRTNNQAGGTGNIYLPLITTGTLQSVSMTEATVISFPAAVIARNPALAGVTVTVPANSLFSDNGTRGGKIGIAPVPPDRLPGPLPPGLELPMVITVQSDGPLNFDKPVPICFPNLPDPVLGTPLPAGSKQALISFNHKKGIWEAVGSMTVSADGKFICTDPGVGILQPGWHGVGPKPQGPPPPPDSCPLDSSPLVDIASAVRPLAALPGPEVGLNESPALPASARPLAPTHQKKKCPPPGKPRKCELAFATEFKCVKACLDAEDACIKANDAHVQRALILINEAIGNGLPAKEADKEVEELLRTKDLLETHCHGQGGRCLLDCLKCFEPSAKAQGRAEGEIENSYRSARPAAPISENDPVAVEIVAIQTQIIALVRPFAISHTALSPEVRDQIKNLRLQTEVIAGGDSAGYLARRAIASEELNAAAATELGVEPEDLDPGNAPADPVFYAASVARPNGLVILRGETGPFGQYSLFVPRDGTLLDVSFYNPKTKEFGIITPNLSLKARFALPSFTLFSLASDALDFDHDGLPDVVENVYGTDPTKADSDGDGISDGVEVEAGTNPLDGFPAQTGIIAAAKTPGAAVDVWAGNDFVVTAEGTSGVTVFKAYDGANPTIIAHVPTPGNAQRVAGAGNFIAVADGDAGLAIIDLSTPAAARISSQLRLGVAQAVAAESGTAYVGLSSGLVVAVDLVRGLVLDQVYVTNQVRDLALAGDYLYALTDDRLVAITLVDGAFAVAGSANAPFVRAPNHRLFVGGGIAYTVQASGYNAFDLADPARPILLTTGNTTQFGWKQMVATGSGLGLAVVGPIFPDDSKRDISLYDLSDPRTNDVFLTLFPTPGIARAVALFNGLAYVADDAAGLEVINYLAYDAKGVPPTIRLDASLPTSSAAEGTPVRVTAIARDDVQVRNVEFYVDGTKVFTDGNFPFEYRFAPPPLTTNKPTVRLRARAIDTGGNFTLSDEIVVNLLPDTRPPRVTAATPIGGGKIVSTILAYFNEPMNPATLSAASFQLFSAGPDGLPGTEDDLAVSGGAVSYRAATKSASLNFAAPLPDGLYRAVVTAAAADLAGNQMGTNYTWQFRVADAVFWGKNSDGSWDDPFNWSTGAVPGSNDDVMIDVPSADLTINLGIGVNVIKNLIAYQRVKITGGSLQISGALQLNQDLTVNGTTIKGGKVTENGGAKLIFAQNNGNTLDGVSVTGDLDLTNLGARLLIRNGLMLTGSVRLDSSGVIDFTGDQTFNAGSVVFAGSGSLLGIEGNTTLTLGPAMVVRGKTGTIGQGFLFGGTSKLINQGLISADVAAGELIILAAQFENDGTLESKNGGALTILSANWSNTGRIDVSSGGALTLNGTWSNRGTINMTDATLNLGGALTLAILGAFNRTGGTVNLTGVLDLGAGTLAMDAATGSWTMNGGTLKGGKVTENGGAKLIFAQNNGNTLDGVSVTGDLDLTNLGARLLIRNGLMLTGSVRLDSSGVIDFTGDQTFNTGSVVFAGGGGLLGIEGNTTLTLGPAMVVRGKTGTIGQGFLFGGTSKLINQGLISADGPGSSLTINPSQFENAGTIVADGAGATVVIRANPFTNTGTIQELNGGKVLINP